MKKHIITLLLIIYYLTSYAQPAQKLKTIANALKEFQTYQTDCKYTFSIPYGDTLTFEMRMVTKKVPANWLCDFYYDFETAEKYRNDKFNDFSIYFDSTVYSSYKGVVKKTTYKESPSQFVDIKMHGGLVPAIQHRPAIYSKTPYEIAKQIDKWIKNSLMQIVQKPDTVINGNTCLRFIVKSGKGESKYPVKREFVKYDLCFDRTEYYPVFYKKEFLTSTINSLEIASFTNTTVNVDLPSDYFTEKNLLPEKLTGGKKVQEKEKYSPTDLVGRKIPVWQLPVFNQNKMYSTDNLEGKVTLLEFTATWCGHCYEAAKMMNRIQKKFKNNKRVEIVSIYSSDLDTEQSVERFHKKNVNPNLTVLYPAVEMVKQYHVNGYPAFFIVSPEGIVLKAFSGYGPTVEKDIVNILTELSK